MDCILVEHKGCIAVEGRACIFSEYMVYNAVVHMPACIVVGAHKACRVDKTFHNKASCSTSYMAPVGMVLVGMAPVGMAWAHMAFYMPFYSIWAACTV